MAGPIDCTALVEWLTLGMNTVILPFVLSLALKLSRMEQEGTTVVRGQRSRGGNTDR